LDRFLPVLPRLRIDGQYLASDSPGSGLHSWFDVLVLADGRAVMIVGDTATDDVGRADIDGSQLRESLVRLLDGDDLAAALERVGDPIEGHDPSLPSTVCVAVVDPLDGIVNYTTSGHPPPLVVAPNNTRYLPSRGKQAPGAGLTAAVDTARLDAHEVLVLHSDGLNPDARDGMTTGLADAARITGAAGSVAASSDMSIGTELACRTILDELRRAGSHDALAVLAVQHRSALSPLTMTVPAVHTSLQAVNRGVGDWLADLRSSVEDGAGVSLAVGEAVRNAVQHAFLGQPIGSVRVEAELQNDGVLAFSVHDDGSWLPSEASQTGRRGRGLRMIERLCDRMVVHRESTGTVLELRRRLHHPVVGAAAASPED